MTAAAAGEDDRPRGFGGLRAILLVFLPFASGFYLSYLFRSVNAVLADPLRAELGLTAGDLGLLTAIYLLAFAAFQVPLGVLLDRFGPRRVQALLLLVAALGAFVFSLGTDEATLILGRALIGLGVSGGLMAGLKAITQWFPQARWPLVNGLYIGMGGLGAMSATAPIEAMLTVTDWRGVFVALVGLTIVIAAAIFLIVPDAGRRGRGADFRTQLRELRDVFRNRLFWRVTPVAVATLAANMAIQGLWAGPWLKDVAGFDRGQVADALLLTALGMTVGSAAMGWLTVAVARRGIGLIPVMAAGVLIFCGAQAVILFEFVPQALWPWFVFGFMSNAAALSYAHLSRAFPLEYAGRVNTALNLVAFIGAFLFQYLMGAIIDLWDPAADGGYVNAAYHAAFGTFLAIQVASFLWLLVPGKRQSEP